ncbi:MAG: hypothetical protein VZR13_05430 [Saccharofermentanaceae bacterium]|nr:hypothetical protein [Saccharofermentanaceae bacterium]
MNITDGNQSTIHFPKRSTIGTLCAIFLPSLLVFGFFYFFMISQINRTVPKLEKQYEIDLGSDELYDVFPHGDGYAYLVNGNEIHIIDVNGEPIGDFRYECAVSAVGNNDGSTRSYSEMDLTVALSDRTLILYRLMDDGKYEELDRMETPSVVTAMICNGHSCYYLLDNGKLYHMSTQHKKTKYVFDDPYLVPNYICKNIRLINNEYYAVGADNSIINLSNGEKITSIKEEIVGIDRYSNVAFTKNKAYHFSFYSETNKVTEGTIFDDGQYYVCHENCFYRKDGVFYYSGLLSGKWRGKGIPIADNRKLKLPQYERYFAISHGVVCYDGQKIICYWV